MIAAGRLWLDELTTAARLVDNSDLSVDLLELVEDTVSQAQGVCARLIHVMEASGLARSLGATSTGALLRDRLRLRPGDAYGRVRTARKIAAYPDGSAGDDASPPGEGDTPVPSGADQPGHATGRDLRDGLIRHDHAAVIVAALGQLSESVGPSERAALEEELRAKARLVDPKELGKIARERVMALNPVPDPPEPGQRRAQRGLSVIERADGLTEFRAVLDELGAEIVRAAIDPLAAPRPGTGGLPDPRTATQRRGDALVEGCERLLTSGGLPTQQRVRPHVSIHVQLADVLGSAWPDAGSSPADWGPEVMGSAWERYAHRLLGGVTGLGRDALPAAAVERVLCDADVRRIVFGPRSEVLDVGRASRVPTAGIRAAVVARDRMCTHPGCDRPAGWSDVHHLRPWGRGGRTSVGNCALVCAVHHDLLHSGAGWEIRLGPSGRVEWRAPADLDPGRRWRANAIRSAREPYAGRMPVGAAA